MRLRHAPNLIGALLITTTASLLASCAPPPVTQAAPTENLLVRGGQLYDDWTAVVQKQPPGSHPAYPATGTQTGSATWLCKECHGWDYRGASGVYAQGSHYTGIKGIRAMAGAPPEQLVAMLRSPPHQYTPDLLSNNDLRALALFISAGQLDTRPFIQSGSGQVRGDAQRGAPLYARQCESCHGADGRQINLGDSETPRYLGAIGLENPWEALHKVRFGQPGSAMPPLQPARLQEQLDVVTYLRSLPAF